MIKIHNETGRIRISDDVLMNLAGDAATSCFGVKGMVACERQGGAWQLLRRETMAKGVKVRNNDDGTVSFELHIGVDRGVNISAVGASIINEVNYKLAQLTGIPIKSVDVFVDTITG